MNKKAEKKVGKSFEELTLEEMNNVQGSYYGWSWSSSSSSSRSCYTTRCSHHCCSKRCNSW